jgi:hypothetical protein
MPRSNHHINTWLIQNDSLENTDFSTPFYILRYNATTSNECHQGFGGTCCHHLQGWRVAQARNHHEAGSKQSSIDLLGLFSENEGNKCPRNLGWLSTGHIVLYPRWQNSSQPSLSEPQILQRISNPFLEILHLSKLVLKIHWHTYYPDDHLLQNQVHY